MQIAFWGVRGSFPVSAPHCVRYGGNTPCIEIRTEKEVIVVDAGTGIRDLGDDLIERRVDEIHLFLSHTHWDHIQGLPHFAPLYRPRTRIHLRGPGRPESSLRELLAAQQAPPYFPLRFEGLPAQVELTEVEEGLEFTIGSLRVQCRRLNHPGVTYGYRFQDESGAFAYLCDVDLRTRILLGEEMEATTDQEAQRLFARLDEGVRDLAHSADLLVCDTFFLPEEYKPDWGHSRPDEFLELALESGVRRMALFHYEPHRSDAQIDAILCLYQEKAPEGLELLAAAEGMEIEL